jgi:hypothetical protein
MSPPRVATGSVTRIGTIIPSLHRVTAILFASVVGVWSSAHAENVSDDSLREIVDGKVWVTENGWGVWTWQTNNELCVRTSSDDKDCADSGPLLMALYATNWSGGATPTACEKTALSSGQSKTDDMKQFRGAPQWTPQSSPSR